MRQKFAISPANGKTQSAARLPFSLPAVLSGAGISLCILFYFPAITQISVGIAALLLYTEPVFAAVGESLLRRSLPPRRDMLLMPALAALAARHRRK